MGGNQETDVTTNLMSYEEYLNKFSTQKQEELRNNDDPDAIAKSLAERTVAVFKQAIKKARYLQVRVDEPEKAAFDAAARGKGLDLSSWVRPRLREAAIKDMADMGAESPFSA